MCFGMNNNQQKSRESVCGGGAFFWVGPDLNRTHPPIIHVEVFNIVEIEDFDTHFEAFENVSTILA